MVVAPDAVVGVIERAGEIGAGIGEREAVAHAAMLGRQLEHGRAIDDFGLDRNQMVRIDLVRHLEQNAAFMPVPALQRVCRPGGVARREIERSGVLGFRLHPGIDPLGEA